MSGATLKLLVLKTHRLEQMRVFYEAMGLSFAAEQHGEGPRHFAASTGGMVLEIYLLPAAAEAETASRLGFELEDPEQFLTQVETLKGGVIQPGRKSAWGFRAIVADPDGRRVEIYRRAEQSA